MNTIKKYSRIVVPAALLVAAGVLAKNVLAGPANEPRDAERRAAKRELAQARGVDERAPVPGAAVVGGNGVVEPADRETKVGGQVSGRIARIAVHEGDFVDVGTPIVELESAAERAALAAADADLDVARATLLRTTRGLRAEDIDAAVAEAEAARERADLSAGTLARTEQLARGGAATPDELERARRQAAADDRTSRAAGARRAAAERGGRAEDIRVARAQVEAAVARRDQARATLDRLTVRSPLAAQVLQIKLRAGEYYTPGGPDPLAVLGDTRTLRVRVDVDERDIGRVKLGASAYVTASAWPDRRFGARVVDVGRRMGRKNVRTDDPTERIDTKILEVVLELKDADGLFPGLRVMGYVEGA